MPVDSERTHSRPTPLPSCPHARDLFSVRTVTLVSVLRQAYIVFQNGDVYDAWRGFARARRGLQELDAFMTVRFIRTSSVIAQPNGESTVLFDMESGRYFSLNDTGSRVWSLCDGTRTSGQIADLMSEEFAVAPETLREDVSELLGELTVRGLVKTTNAAE